MACTGWTWAEVGRLTLPRYIALSDYWSRHPPIHLLIGAWLGVGKEAPKTSAQDFDSFFQELTGATPPL